MSGSLRIVFLGLSITSSWGNGHATTYRGLIRELARMGHSILFLEKDVPWYAENRDLPAPPYCKTELYASIDELKERFSGDVSAADAVVVGSYVPEGAQAGNWVIKTAKGIKAFYDIDTPVTLAKLSRGDTEYLAPELVPNYDLYLSFTGGPTLKRLEREYGSPMARPLYCSFDPEMYYPTSISPIWDMGYLGTFSDDRQPILDSLMLQPARNWSCGRFVVAGPQYPESISWPNNVQRINHLPPTHHRSFYNSQRFTLNVTRADMVAAGYSPSVRLFEAAACATPIISDYWEGLETIFKPGEEILISRSPEETLNYLRSISDSKRQGMGLRARSRVMAEHTAAHRAQEFLGYLAEARKLN
jgi:spore maturation protein CgeB